MKYAVILLSSLFVLSGCVSTNPAAQKNGPGWSESEQPCHVSHISYAGSGCRFDEDNYLRTISYN